MTTDKMRRFAGSLHTVFKVFFWVSLVVAILSAISIIIVLVVPGEIWQGQLGSKVYFSTGDVVRYQLDLPPDQLIDYKPLLLVYLTSLAVGVGVIAVIHYLLADILRRVKEGDPFAKENGTKISVIGAIILVGSFVVNLMQAAITYAGIVVYNIKNISVNISPDMTMIFLGLLLLILAGIFRYGSYLQDEVDATL